jgi:hypothetical protein
MPFYLEEKDYVSELAGYRSVLIVPCRFCPAASAAVKNDEPYIEFFKRLLKTAAYEQQIRAMRSRLEKEGISSKVFRSHSVHQFVLCMWTGGRRQKLRKAATRHEAVVVMGCEAAYETVADALKSTDCQVIHGMRTEGIMNVIPKFQLPGTLSLKRVGMTRVLE